MSVGKDRRFSVGVPPLSYGFTSKTSTVINIITRRLAPTRFDWVVLEPAQRHHMADTETGLRQTLVRRPLDPFHRGLEFNEPPQQRRVADFNVGGRLRISAALLGLSYESGLRRRIRIVSIVIRLCLAQ